MKPFIISMVFVAASSVVPAATKLTRFEKQLRSDLHSILKSRWSAQKATERADVYADKWLVELKKFYPDLLADEAEPTIPTDQHLLELQKDAADWRGPKSRGEIWRFYHENWTSQRLSSDQKILFRRFLELVIQEAMKR